MNYVPKCYKKSVLVLGCGNILFGDDGFGPAVVEHLQFDLGQAELNESDGDYHIPVFHYSQLLGLALGFDAVEVAKISKISRDEVINKVGG